MSGDLSNLDVKSASKIDDSTPKQEKHNDENDDSEQMQEKQNEIVYKIDKKLPRSQRKRLWKEQRRAVRQSKKQERIVNKDKDNQEREATHKCQKRKEQDDGYVSKRMRLQQMKERCQEGLKTGQRVCIDLSLEKHMNQKELGKLAQQLCRLYGANRQAEIPMHVYFAGLKKDSELYMECTRKNEGFDGYLVDMKEKLPTDLFSKEEIVYLTPDSENVLETVEKDKVYIIGGLVDESITNNITNTNAKQNGIQTARLPIEEMMKRQEDGSFIKVLAVNQVFEILLELSQSGNWKKALKTGVPRRTGYYVDEENSENTKSDQEHSTCA